MPRRIELEPQRDFTGGLNLVDDTYNLAKNESFDLQNVDIDRRGGFGVRRGGQRFIPTATTKTITSTGAARAANVVTASGLVPVNGLPGGLVVGDAVSVDYPLGAGGTNFDGAFIVVTAVPGAATATWAQTAANDSTGGGIITEGLKGSSGTGTPDSGYTFVDTSNVRHILAARAGSVKRWDGAVWQWVRAQVGQLGRTRFIEYDNVLYFTTVGSVSVPFKWTGTGLATQLTGTAGGGFNDDLAAPNFGNMPHCRTFAVHHEVVWAGAVLETGPVTENSRVRWSHPGSAEDWRTNDFIDLDPDDENGVIRALVPFGDRLLVFKDKAIYAIHGYPPAGFSVENLTKELGTPSQQSVVATPDAVYFWDVDRGAYKYDGKTFEWIFHPIFPLLDDEKINTPFSFQVIAEYHNDRLWLSVPMQAAPYAGTFIGLVYSPFAGKAGAWTVHTNTLFGWWIHRGSDGGDLHLLGGDNSYVYELDVKDLFQDQQANGSYARIIAWYTTRWFDSDNSAMKKRWKRPVVVMRGGSTQTTLVEVMNDYDPTHVTKSFNLVTTLTGSEGIWDVSNWDVGLWAAEVTIGGERSVILTGAPLGPGVAKALRFKNTTIGQDWRVHGLTMKWVPRKIRN